MWCFTNTLKRINFYLFTYEADFNRTRKEHVTKLGYFT